MGNRILDIVVEAFVLVIVVDAVVVFINAGVSNVVTVRLVDFVDVTRLVETLVLGLVFNDDVIVAVTTLDDDEPIVLNVVFAVVGIVVENIVTITVLTVVVVNGGIPTVVVVKEDIVLVGVPMNASQNGPP